jgi:CRP/FNR family transcriptional regulator
LCRAGDRFDAVYVVRCGFLKTLHLDQTGTEQVQAFPMGGDVIGLDGIDAGRYSADVIALDTSQVVVVPFSRLAQLGRDHPCLERLLYRLFSHELVRKHGMIWLLGTLGADARVATFLLDLSERFGRLGFSRSSFVLRMTRHEIGSYLGIQLETVSRTLSAFSAAGLLKAEGKTITLCNVPALRRIVEPREEAGARALQRLQRVAA